MFFRKTIKNKTLFRLSLVTTVFAFAVVILGAYTRLVDAGLGCPDWPGCYGHFLWPNQPDEIAKAEARFPDAPVELDKTWPEMVHRYFAGVLGLIILTIVLTAIHLRRQTQHVPLKLPLLILIVVILQGVFGMWTVTLKLWPKVVTGHLLGGFATLSLLWLLVQRLGAQTWSLSLQESTQLKNSSLLLWLALILLVMQIALGGWVSSNYAALACADIPLCHGQWLPETDFRAGFNLLQDIGPNYLGGQLDNKARTAIHLGHRLGAILTALTIILLGIRLWSVGNAQVKSWVLLLWAILVIQLTLGISNIVFVLPLYIAVGHNVFAAVLLLVIIAMIYRSQNIQTNANSNSINNE